MTNGIWDRQDEIERQQSRCEGDYAKQLIATKINQMTDEEFMCTYNPYYIIPEGKEDKVWFRYQSDLTGDNNLVDKNYSLHRLLIHKGMTEARRSSSGTVKGMMKLFCTRIEHLGDSMFRFSLEDAYGNIVSEPISYNHRLVPDTVGRLLKVECTFSGSNVSITDIKIAMRYDDVRRLESSTDRYVG